jgi:hypothetical protein
MVNEWAQKKDALVVTGDALGNQPGCTRLTFKEARK